MKNVNLVLKVEDRLTDCDGPTRHVLITMANSIEGDVYSRIPINQKDISKRTGIGTGKVRDAIRHLLLKQYITELSGDRYLNTFKLKAMNKGQYLPERVPYRKGAA